jgi:hypothetical protein
MYRDKENKIVILFHFPLSYHQFLKNKKKDRTQIILKYRDAFFFCYTHGIQAITRPIEAGA